MAGVPDTYSTEQLTRLAARMRRTLNDWAHDEFDGCDIPLGERRNDATTIRFGAAATDRDQYAIAIVTKTSEYELL